MPPESADRPPVPFHPIACALFPVIALYSANFEQAVAGEVPFPLLFILLLTAAVWWLLSRLINGRCAAILVSGALLLCFSYMHVYFSLRFSLFGKLHEARHVFLLPVWALLGTGLGFSVLRRRISFNTTTRLLNIFTLALLFMSLFMIGQKAVRRVSEDSHDAPPHTFSPVSETPDAMRKSPDVYYIVLDRYASPDLMLKENRLDITPFVEYLRSKGFYVAQKSHSNYMKTALSLAATLNMDYLPFPQAGNEPAALDWNGLFVRIKKSEVFRYFKARGYLFHHFGSFYHPTFRNRLADFNYNPALFTEFSRELFMTTIFYPLGTLSGLYDPRKEEWNRESFKFKKLADLPRTPGPLFAFAHFTVTHGPYVMEADGRFLKESRLQELGPAAYPTQVEYANARLRAFIDQALADSARRPVIILQADEGNSFPRLDREGKSFDWTSASSQELCLRTGIFSAFYFPPGTKGVEMLYDSISPVNTFRVVLSSLFSEPLPLLPDRTFFIENEKIPGRMFEATDQIRTCR